MKVFQLIGAHPRVLLVNQLQSREEKWYRQAQYVHSLPDGPKLRHLQDQGNSGSLHKTHWRSVLRAGIFGDLITSDHEVLREGCES